MITITLKYTDYGHKETQEFREYVKNLVGYRDNGEYNLRFGVEEDPMFDNKIVAEISISDEDYAFDVVNHFMVDREVKGESVPFDVDISSISMYVSGSYAIANYITSRSFSYLYERVDILENAMAGMVDKYSQLEANYHKMATFIEKVGVDKFPDIVRQLVESMEAEGHECKTQINEILQRKVH